jgi:signal transduction histidine kinase
VKSYPGIHAILEFFTISIAFSIFTYGWKTFTYTKSLQLLLLSYTFLTVGLIDLLHALSYHGMPFFIEESSDTNSTWFWIAARISQAVLLVSILLISPKVLSKDLRLPLFAGSILLVLLVAVGVFSYGEKLPVLVIEGKGTTPLKNGMEYFVAFLNGIAIFVSFKNYRKSKDVIYLNIMIAFFFILIAELIFTQYLSLHSPLHFSGHVIRAIGYFYILKGYYFSQIDADKRNEMKIADARHELNIIMKEQQGLIFKIIKVGNEYKHTLFDGELREKLHLTREEVYGKSAQEVIPENYPILLEKYRIAWEEGERVTFEIKHREYFLYVLLKPVFEDGKVIEVIGSVTDISKVKVLEETVRNNEKLGILGELAAGIAHEVRNPLTTLKGFLQLIKPEAGDRNKMFIDLMLAEVNRIEMITDEFMSIARPQALIFKEENTYGIIEEVIPFMEPQSLLKGVTVHLYASAGNYPVVCEKNQLKQVFINLIKNALEAMPDGGNLYIIVKKNNGYNEISFVDEGTGIPEEVIKKLGQPFFTMKEGGHGLGLMMCNRIIEAHGGYTNIKSQVGKGTEFKIFLPMENKHSEEQGTIHHASI